MFGLNKGYFLVFQKTLNIGFHIVEIYVACFLTPLLRQHRAIPQTADTFVLNKLISRIFAEHTGNFKYAYTVLLTIQIVLQNFHQTADKRRTHDGILRRQRILQADRIGIGSKVLLPLLIHKRIADHFAVTASRHFVINRKTRTFGFRQSQHFQTA